MGRKSSYLSPVFVTEADGVVSICYDQVEVGIPSEGPVPEDVPALARRVFEAVKDLRRPLHAE
jgi:hypothetical protein